MFTQRWNTFRREYMYRGPAIAMAGPRGSVGHTLLIVDPSGGDLPDVRYWKTSFAPPWQPTDTYSALGAMHPLTTRRVPEIRFSVNPHADEATVGVAAEPLRGVASLADLANRADPSAPLTAVEPKPGRACSAVAL